MWFPTSVTGFWTFFENYPQNKITPCPTMYIQIKVINHVPHVYPNLGYHPCSAVFTQIVVINRVPKMSPMSSVEYHHIWLTQLFPIQIKVIKIINHAILWQLFCLTVSMGHQHRLSSRLSFRLSLSSSLPTRCDRKKKICQLFFFATACAGDAELLFFVSARRNSTIFFLRYSNTATKLRHFGKKNSRIRFKILRETEIEK